MRDSCGRERDGHKCTLHKNHGGKIHTEVTRAEATPADTLNSRAFSWHEDHATVSTIRTRKEAISIAEARFKSDRIEADKRYRLNQSVIYDMWQAEQAMAKDRLRDALARIDLEFPGGDDPCQVTQFLNSPPTSGKP